MTAVRPWASAACLAGRSADCPLVHTDGRRCANPAHTAYPDALEPAGEQSTLDVDPIAAAVDDALKRQAAAKRRRRWRCDRCGELVIRAEHVTGTGYACEPSNETDPGPFGAADEQPSGPGVTMVDYQRERDADATPPTDEPPWHNHAWQPMDDPHHLYRGKAYLCACGDSMDETQVYPFGNLPDVGDQDPHDSLEHATVPVDYKRPDGPRGPLVAEVGATGDVALTAGEVKRITAAHMVLRPEQALNVVRTILTERRTHPNGAPN